MNGAVCKPMPVCMRNTIQEFVDYSHYNITWCGIVYQTGSYSAVTREYDYVTCERCKEEYALGLLADLP